MDSLDLRKMKRPRLIELAAQFKIKKRHRMRKRDLVKRLEKLVPQLAVKPSLVTQRPRTVESSRMPAPPPPPPREFVDRGAPLPLHYGEDRITALVRDPNCLYVYWEIEGSRRNQVKQQFGQDVFDGASWVLRLHSDGFGPYDIPVIVEGCNWYLQVPEDRSFVVEIGIVTRSGQFIGLASSNRVRTPRMGISSDESIEWMLVEEDFRRVVRVKSGEAPKVDGKFADTLAERFRVPGMSSLFLGGSERARRVPGSAQQLPSSRVHVPGSMRAVTPGSMRAVPGSGHQTRHQGHQPPAPRESAPPIVERKPQTSEPRRTVEPPKSVAEAPPSAPQTRDEARESRRQLWKRLADERKKLGK